MSGLQALGAGICRKGSRGDIALAVGCTPQYFRLKYMPSMHAVVENILYKSSVQNQLASKPLHIS
jgi:hypothetical protein